MRSPEGSLPPVARYALPRVFSEIAGNGDQRTPERFTLALDLLEQAYKHSDRPAKCIALFAESALKQPELEQNINALTLLSHIFPDASVPVNEKTRFEYGNIISALEAYAPRLWSVLNALSREDKQELGIIQFARHDTWWWNLAI